jgi:hypothetical protein
MGDEKKDDGVCQQRNIMMEKFMQILRRLPTGEASSSSGHATPFKVHVNFYIPLFEGMIDADVVDKWLNMLEQYFSVHNFSDRENITFSLLKVVPHVKHCGILTLSKGPHMHLKCLWWPLHGIPSRIPLKKNTTMLEATGTSTPDGPLYVKKGTKQYQISPIFSIKSNKIGSESIIDKFIIKQSNKIGSESIIDKFIILGMFILFYKSIRNRKYTVIPIHKRTGSTGLNELTGWKLDDCYDLYQFSI